MRRRIGVGVLLLAMVAAACGGDGEAGGGGVTVVATTSIVGDVVANVVGDAGRVEVIIPVGADAHEFQPSSQQVASLQQADLVVAVGMGLEEGLVQALEAARLDGANVLELAPRLDPIPLGPWEHDEDEDGDHDEDHEDGDDDHASEDPHVWMDPLRMAEAARLIAAELELVAPGGGWEERAEQYAGELETAHRQMVEILAAVPARQRKLVTNHEAFGYFAERYGLVVVGVVIPGGSTLAEPSSEELAELVHLIEEEGVEAIFAETTQPSALADAIAAEVGDEVQVVELYSESLGEPGSGADTLIGMLLTNAERVAAALS